ncbi:hypothetical protein HK405_004949, partial [Cladochytrium tenue]
LFESRLGYERVSVSEVFHEVTLARGLARNLVETLAAVVAAAPWALDTYDADQGA